MSAGLQVKHCKECVALAPAVRHLNLKLAFHIISSICGLADLFIVGSGAVLLDRAVCFSHVPA